MEYVVFNKTTGEIHSYGGRPDSDPYTMEVELTGTHDVLFVSGGSHDYYVDVKNRVLVRKPPKPGGVAVFNYHTKQWDVDHIATVRAYRTYEYPPIGDQLDALWKLIQANSDKIDLGEAAPLLAAVQEVKDKYPKAP